MKKKVLSLFLCLLMIVSIVPMGTISASALTGDQRTDIINVAIGQLGNTNGSKYTFGAGNVSWCAYFIVWCARQANIDNSIIKTTGWADADDLGVKYYSRGSYTPKKGDIIIFDYPPYSTKTPASSYGDHVGLVEYVEGSTVHTIEGNSSPSPNAVRRHSYALTNSNIKGYGVPAYKGSTPTSHTVDSKYGKDFTAYLKNPGTNHYVTDANHGSTSHYVNGNDPCTIHEVYTDGCCKFTYKLDSGSTRTAYGKISWFNTHTHNYTNRLYEPEHPHRISIRCSDFDSCGGWKWTDEYYTDLTCTKCCENATYTLSASPSSLTMRVGETKSITFTESSSGFTVYMNGKYSSSYLSNVEFGNWVDGCKRTLTFKAIKAGNAQIVVDLYASLTDKVMKSITVPVTVLPNSYTISYDANGGSPTFQEKTDDGGTYIFTSKQPTRTGHTFLGWHINKDSAKATPILQPGKYFQAKENTTFYAIWTPNTLSVSYNANGGTIISDTYKLSNNIIYTTSNNTKFAQVWTYNEKQTNGLYNAKTFGLTREGYTFKGWGTTASGGTVFDQDDSTLVPTSINSSIKNGNCTTTLYAIWEKIPATVSSISIQSKPTKTTYMIGDTFSSSGLSIKVNMSDGTSKTVTSGFTLSSPDMSTTGTKTVTVTYQGKTTSFTVTVQTPSISVSSTSKTMTVGDTVTLTATTTPSGQTVIWTSSNTSVASVSNGVVTAKASGTAIITAKFTYNGSTYSKTCNFTVNNPPATVSSIAVQSKPTKTVYTVGEAFNSSGLSIKVNMSDGTSKTVTSGFTVSAPNMSTAGTKTVTVTYQGKTATFTITVNPVSTNNPSIKIDAGKAVCGQQIKVPVTVEKTDLGTLTVDITYDSLKLKIASIDEIPFDMYDTNTKTAGKIRITATGNSSVPAGKVAVLTFDVIAQSACKADITITVDEAYDANDNAVKLTVFNGVLEILKAVPGDINGDGKVSAIDARIALQYNAGNKELTAEQLAAADVNGDGKVSAIDARWILQAVAGNRTL